MKAKALVGLAVVALVTFAVMPLVWLTARIFRRRVRLAFSDIRVRLARLNAFLQERLSGMRVVQLFGREEASARRVAELNREHLLRLVALAGLRAEVQASWAWQKYGKREVFKFRHL
jgi:ABC-type multidrug transport system fused ATPase/permease subunit